MGLAGCESGSTVSLNDRAQSQAAANESATQAEAQGAEIAPAPGRAAGTRAEPPTARESPLPKAEIYRGTGRFTRDRAPRRDVRAGDDGYTLNFAEADIRDVVDAVLGGALGENYAVHPDVSGTITARTTRPLSRERVVPALESVLAMNGAALVRDQGVYRVVPLSEAGSAAPVVADSRRGDATFALHVIPLDHVGAEEVQGTLEQLVAPGRTLHADSERNLLLFRGPGSEARDLVDTVRIFDVDWLAGMSFALLPLEMADAEDIVDELRTVFGQDAGGPAGNVVRFLSIARMNAVLVIASRPAYLARARTWVSRLDRGMAGDQRRLFVYRVQNGRAQDLANVLGSVFDVRTVNTRRDRGGQNRGGQNRDGQVAPGRESARVTSDGDETGSQGGGGQNGGRQNGGSQDGDGLSQGDLSRLRGRPQNSAGGGLNGGGGGGFGGEGGPRIIADARNNALLILASGREYRMIESTLEKLDLVPLQVMIEATIAEISLNDALNYGVRFFFQGEESGLGSASATFSDLASGNVSSSFPGFSFLAQGADASVALNALEQVTDVNVVSSPQLMVLDNETARLNVGDQVPVATQSAVSTSDTDAPIVNSIELRDTGVILEITPRVNNSGLVVLDVLQEVSDVTATTTSDLDSPTIEQRTISTSVAVQSGETIALGGLIRDSREDSSSGIPLLMDIPVLGNLFKSRGIANDRTELLILLRPRVVRNPNEARAVTRELRQRVHGLNDLQNRIGRGREDDGAERTNATE